MKMEEGFCINPVWWHWLLAVGIMGVSLYFCGKYMGYRIYTFMDKVKSASCAVLWIALSILGVGVVCNCVTDGLVSTMAFELISR